jgi:hypothetical protein
MILTKQEKKSIINKVMESYQNITLSEVKTNNNIRSEIQLNFKFYNEVKKGFINENKTNILEIGGVLGGILGVLGNIKDFLSGLKLVKDGTAIIKKILATVFNKIKGLIEKYIPGGEVILKGAKYVAEKITSGIKWLYETLSYKGLAKLFAMIRYRTLMPSDEQKECMVLAAQKAYRWILISLLAAFAIKTLPLIATAFTTTAATSATLSAGFPLAIAFAPIKTALASAGVKTIFTKLFSIGSAIMKKEDYDKLSKEIEAEEATAKAGELDTIGEAWNKCPLSKADQKNVDNVNKDVSKRMGDMSKNMAMMRENLLKNKKK